MKKNILIAASLSFLLVIQYAGPAFASSQPVTKPAISTTITADHFRDVASDHIWYAGIQKGVERGIVKGGLDGKFNPDRPITVPELAIMFCRAFAKDLPSDTDPIQYCVQKDWLSTNSFFDLQSKFESSIFYERLFSAAGIYLYPAELYKNARKDVPNAVRVAMEFGLWDEQTPVGSFITRGAAVSKIVAMQDNTKKQALPDICAILDITEETPGLNGMALVNLQDVPQSILTRFKELDWRLELGTKAMSTYNAIHGTTGVAMTSFDRKTIYIVDDRSVTHEFGHFLMYITPDADTALSGIFRMEGERGGELLGSYAQSSKEEYFAEMFSYWIKHRDHEKEMKKLLEKAPQTYHYLADLESAGWVK